MASAIAKIDGFIRDGGFHHVVTADASMIVDAQTDTDLRRIIEEAALVTPDSAGVLWGARKLGLHLPAKVSGVDLVDEVCALSSRTGCRVFFLGAEPGIADLAREKLSLRHPGCNIVGSRHGYFPAESDEVVAQEVAEFQPDVLFVAMGIPRQEKFIRKTAEIIKPKVAIGVGGSFDVYSGKTKRAPVICQKLKIEWLWRLLLNPSKWRKTLKLPQYVKLILRSRR